MQVGIAAHMRTIPRTIGIAPALVLRELNAPSKNDVGVRITKRDVRTVRTFYELTRPPGEAELAAGFEGRDGQSVSP